MSDKLLHVLLIEDNPGDAILVQEMLFDAEGTPFTLDRAGSLIEGLDKVSQMKVDVILLDLNLPDSHGIETLLSLKSHAAGTPIVVLTGQDNEILAHNSVEAGAQDYLSKDKLKPELLARALRYAVLRHHKHPEESNALSDAGKGKVIALLGAKGGVGTSTVACHLAVELRRQTGQPVLLLDLDVAGVTDAFLMQSHNAYSILDAADNLHRLDLSFWQSLVTHTADIDFIGWPHAPAGDAESKAGRVLHTVRFTRQHYPWVVADMGRFNAFSARILKSAQEVVVVTTTDVVALFQLKRLVADLSGVGLAASDISVIQNQAGKWSNGGEVIQAVADAPVRAVLPSSREELTDAYTRGRLAPVAGRFRKEIAKLAREIAEIRQPPENTGFSLARLALFGAKEDTSAKPIGG